MHTAWLTALREGLRNVRFTGVEDITMECAFYGHLYNDGKAGATWQYVIGDVRAGVEEDLLVALAAEIEDPSRETRGKAGYAPQSVQGAIRVLQSRRFFGGTAAGIIGFVKQVARYLRDEDFRSAVQGEFSAAMEARPRLVIAHSLGSVVAYDWLRSHAATSATTLVTLGSPLGLYPVLRELHPFADVSQAPWPVGIDTWVNVAAKEDVVASVKELHGLFAGRIQDLPASNSRGTAHDVTAYLKNVRTARSVKVALD